MTAPFPPVGGLPASPPAFASQPALVQRRPYARTGAFLRSTIFLYIALYLGRFHEALGFSFPIGKVLLPLGWLSLILTSGFEKRLRLLKGTQAVMFGLFILAMFNSIPFSLWVGGSLNELKLFLTGAAIAVPLIALSSVEDRDLYHVTRAVVLGSGGLGFLMLAGFGHLSRSEGRGSFGSTYDPNDIALVGVMGFPLALMIMRDQRGWWRWLGAAGAVGAASLVVMSASRGGTIGLAAVVVLILVKYSGRISFRWKLATAALLIGALYFAPPTFWSRIVTLQAPGQDYNATEETGRVAIWKRGLGYFTEHPLNGVGLGMFGAAEGQWAIRTKGSSAGFSWSAAHSIWIQTMAELGLPGIIAFLGLYLPTLRDVNRLRRLRRPREPADDRLIAMGEALAVSIIGFFVSGTFLAMAFSPPAMLLAALGMVFSNLARSRIPSKPRVSRLAHRYSGPALAPGA